MRGRRALRIAWQSIGPETIETLGPDRIIYAGDYPVCLQATTLPRWVEVWDRAFADLGLSEADTQKIYRDNASAFYRLGL